ncbi:hypothetical protein [Marivita sp. S2033]|uniref:hypothetical protein n=1 Tax=Marivita sp. S2033 TaxID=3373187 RepID=UPI003982667E
MCAADVTVISLVTDLAKDKVCAALVVRVSDALASLGIRYQRLPITRDYIDWSLDESDQLTVALDDANDSSIILVAIRSANSADSAAQLANIGAELCRSFDVHTVYWNGASTPISAAAFLGKPGTDGRSISNRRTVYPRKVSVQRPSTRRQTPFPTSAKLETWVMRGLRARFKEFDAATTDRTETDPRRATSVPLRLAAWALSLTTAIFMLPLAIPLIAHNLVRGEDVRSGAMALGVAGLFASLAHSGMAPALSYLYLV